MSVAGATRRTIAWFTFRRLLKGALLFGVAGGVLVAVQGAGFVQGFPDEISRAKFAQVLVANPVAGALYSDPLAVNTPGGYMVYRCLPILALVGGLWALSTVTKLLRGQEEDGQWEIMLAGPLTSRDAVGATLMGVFGALITAWTAMAAIIVPVGLWGEVGITLPHSLFFALAIMCGPLVFAAIGVLVSQLAATRQRAMLYGAAALTSFFVMRSLGSMASSVEWLKYFTPFGWIDKLHPVAGASPIWLVPLLLVSAVCISLGCYWAGRRDLGASLIAAPEYVKPKRFLLGGAQQLALRLTIPNMIAWLGGCLGMVTVLGLIANAAAESVSDAPALSKTIAELSGGNETLALSFVGIGSFFVATLLMLMAASVVTAMKEEETRNYLDIVVSGPVSRTAWFAGRAMLVLGAATVICAVSAFVAGIVARSQGIPVHVLHMTGERLSVLGPIALLLGIGLAMYGFKPRLAAAGMYGLIIWSFVVELLGSVFSWQGLILKTSLLHYVAMAPAVDPDWLTVVILIGIGGVLAIVGIVAFKARDLQTD